MEAENVSLQEQVKALEGTQDEDRKRIQELTEEVSALRLAHNESISESKSLGLELEQAKNDSTPGIYVQVEQVFVSPLFKCFDSPVFFLTLWSL